MARDFIKVSRQGPQSSLLLSAVSAQRQAYNLLTQCKAIMSHLNDGSNFSDIESAFGLEAGQGQILFDLVNGAVGSMEGQFQVNDAKTITEKVG